MDKWKLYMKNQLRKLKTTTSGFISESGRTDDEAPLIELDPRSYELLKEIADRGQTSVAVLVNRAISQFIDNYDKENKRRISIEQKEKNPLLHLDAFTKTYRKYNGDGGMVQ